MKEQPLTDSSPMPYGLHQGTPMREMPVGYLQMMWNCGVNEMPDDPFHVYIKRNLKDLIARDRKLEWLPATEA